MGKPAARIGDMHVCPMVTPGTPPIPHVGGPLIGPGCPTVLIGGMPAAVLGDMCVCTGPPDTIAMGSSGVMIGGKPAARVGDQCAHGGTITIGCSTVLIGETMPVAPGPLTEDLIATAAKEEKPGEQTALTEAIPGTDATEKNGLDMIAFTLVNQDGSPVQGMKYEITLPDKSRRKGLTDSSGHVLITDIEPGDCEISFPDLHAAEWN